MANRPTFTVLAVAGAFAAGVGVTALYSGASQPAADPASVSPQAGVPIGSPAGSPRGPSSPTVRGTLPPLSLGTAQGAPREVADAGVADPRLQALEAQVARLSALVEQQQGTSGPGARAGVVGAAAPAQPLYPAPFILPGTEQRAGGPILAAYGPPPPFNTGSRAPDPPAVAGAGCSTCESGAAAQR